MLGYPYFWKHPHVKHFYNFVYPPHHTITRIINESIEKKTLGSRAETKGERGEGCNLRLPKSSQLQYPTKERHPRGEHFWLVVSTHLKNISQIGNLPQIGVNIKNIWNHQLDFVSFGGINVTQKFDKIARQWLIEDWTLKERKRWSSDPQTNWDAHSLCASVPIH